MSFFDEYNTATNSKKTSAEASLAPAPVLQANSGSFYDEFTATKPVVKVAPVKQAIPTAKVVEATVSPSSPLPAPSSVAPKIDNPSAFSSFYNTLKKTASTFVSDGANILAGMTSIPRDLDIYGTKAVKALDSGISRGINNPQKITDKDYSLSKNKDYVSPQAGFYQNIIDDLGRGKLDEKNWDTKIQNKVAELGNKLQVSAGVDPNNRTFGQKLSGGFGSMVGIFLPSFTLAKTASLLIRSEKAAETYSKVGQASMLVTEASMESNGVFKQVYEENGGNVQEAQAKADNTFGANLLLIGITNHYSKYFESAGTGFRNLLKGAVVASISEGGQEGGQAIISNINTGRPIFEGVGESVLIGAIVGGVTHTAGQALTPKEKGKLNDLKDKILTENKDNPIVADYIKNEKVKEEVFNYVANTKEVETPEQIVEKLVEAGIDHETAVQILIDENMESMQTESNISDDTLQAEIESFMGSVDVKEIETTPTTPVATITATKPLSAQEAIAKGMTTEESLFAEARELGGEEATAKRQGFSSVKEWNDWLTDNKDAFRPVGLKTRLREVNEINDYLTKLKAINGTPNGITVLGTGKEQITDVSKDIKKTEKRRAEAMITLRDELYIQDFLTPQKKFQADYKAAKGVTKPSPAREEADKGIELIPDFIEETKKLRAEVDAKKE
ncbi:MAG: hypothetical protein SGJ02_10690, partial [bacterium]|nr:hypothetical protein [bacterium]